MLSDIQIAQDAVLKPISDVAASIGLLSDELELYGRYKAKISLDAEHRLRDRENGRLILVTAMSPTPSGEGKTTVTVGLSQSLCALGKKAVVTLREPSLGPVFGMKGGAAGGGYAQVVPMEELNLHFTGDMHAISAANNLLCALIDNHIHQKNALGFDVRRPIFPRVVDMNDRSLRHITVGLGGAVNGVPREDGYKITVASEVMAILCLAEGYADLKRRLSHIIVGQTPEGKLISCGELKAEGAMAALLKEALKPNLVQTLSNTPCIVHGGPFANIAHGCNSVKATKLALKLGDYCVTEAGFGADLGAEKFFDIKCKKSGLVPDCAVVVATVRALKHNAYIPKDELWRENVPAVLKGCENLARHIENVGKFGVPAVVAINRFESDTDAELAAVLEFCKGNGVGAALCEAFSKGAEGGILLAEAVLSALETKKSAFKPLYEDTLPLAEKIGTIVKEIYRGEGVLFEKRALDMIKKIEDAGYKSLPVCMAKTQYSFSDDPKQLGAPEGFKIRVSDVTLSAGAGFVVALTGEIMTMPGLPKSPAAERIDIDENGVITGLF